MPKIEKRQGKVVLVIEKEVNQVNIDEHIKRIDHEIQNIERNIAGLQKRKEELLKELSQLKEIKSALGA